eukprot:gnl/MRDRNA2_/MRDRNA2_120726_c0_seq1.p1 gnl/MRDRNA2_/MRDRNA2_120726_c0~~gnl/MRDRNA2_/MRDRNA2_120726_c0_seq1.p1  ORF type:complete len:443 (-),score=96.55 gnl/MRDRNA2_/MRDRNA2_120726_c0_seq1:24-1352(-)
MAHSSNWMLQFLGGMNPPPQPAQSQPEEKTPKGEGSFQLHPSLPVIQRGTKRKVQDAQLKSASSKASAKPPAQTGLDWSGFESASPPAQQPSAASMAPKQVLEKDSAAFNTHSTLTVPDTELRYDPTDGALYPKATFLGLYGAEGETRWGKAELERRIDISDGQPYIKQSFIEVYGGTSQWDSAAQWLPSKQDEALQAQQALEAQQNYAVYMEMLKAQQEMQAQQAQFLQEVNKPEIKPGRTTEMKESRFVDDFRPTELCVFMRSKKWCKFNDRCPFAHTVEELHEFSSDLPENQIGPNDEPRKPELVMTKKRELCRRFATGKCLLGKICNEAHTQRELGSTGMSVSGFVKVELCPHFEQNKCRLGGNCGLAHGMKEIGMKRPPPDVVMTTPTKRPKHLPMFKDQLPELHPDQRKEYEAYLRELEQVKRDHALRYAEGCVSY